MSKLPVPHLTESAIRLAHLCALETWQGFNYATGKRAEFSVHESNLTKKSEAPPKVIMSDEYILQRCTNQLFSRIRPQEIKNTFHIEETFLVAFRNVAGILTTERRGPTPEYAAGIRHIKTSIVADYRSCRRAAIASKNTEVLKSIENLSVAFSAQPSNATNSEHVMLATRLLFFFMPDMPVFNYSPDIAALLKLSKNAQNDIQDYQHELWNGLLLNWPLLCRYEMPPSTSIDQKIYKQAKQSGWWQRRIFDLALKIYSGSKQGIKINERVKQNLFTNPFPAL